MKKTISLSILIAFGLVLVLALPAEALTKITPPIPNERTNQEQACVDKCWGRYGDPGGIDKPKFLWCYTGCMVGISSEHIDQCRSQCVKIDPAEGEIFNRCVSDCLKSPIAVKGDIVRVLDTVINWLSIIIGTIATLMIVIGGIMYMTAAGDEDRVGKAKNVIKFAVIGLVIALLAWGVKSIILSFM